MPPQSSDRKANLTSPSIGDSLLAMVGLKALPSLKLGDALPSVSAKNQNGEKVDLADHASATWLLVYFYPKANTPGCTAQARSLRDNWDELLTAGVEVIGVSKDSVSSQKKFSEQKNLPFTLLADGDGTIANALGVPHIAGMTKRSAFLFHNGSLVWKDLSASTSKQAADVLKVVQNH